MLVKNWDQTIMHLYKEYIFRILGKTFYKHDQSFFIQQTCFCFAPVNLKPTTRINANTRSFYIGKKYLEEGKL